MKVAILGATGPTGLRLIDEALSAGHTVVALVRNPEKISVKHENLEVQKTDLFDISKVAFHLQGCDAVLSSVGGKPGLFSSCNVYSGIGKATVSAMRETGVKKLITVTAWGTKDDPNLPNFLRYVLKPAILRSVYKDMEMWEDYLIKECADLNYVIVKPPRLLDTPVSDEKMQVSEGQCVMDSKEHHASRQALARFMIECLTKDEYNQKLIAVNDPTNGKESFTD